MRVELCKVMYRKSINFISGFCLVFWYIPPLRAITGTRTWLLQGQMEQLPQAPTFRSVPKSQITGIFLKISAYFSYKNVIGSPDWILATRPHVGLVGAPVCCHFTNNEWIKMLYRFVCAQWCCAFLCLLLLCAFISITWRNVFSDVFWIKLLLYFYYLLFYSRN